MYTYFKDRIGPQEAISIRDAQLTKEIAITVVFRHVTEVWAVYTGKHS